MMKERGTPNVPLLRMGLFLLVILSVASSPVWALSGDFDDLLDGSLAVGLMAKEELNLLPPGALKPKSPGATIKGSLFVFGPFQGELGGTVNVDYALVRDLVWVGPGAKVTIKGKDFAVSGSGKLDHPTNPTTVTFVGGLGTLKVTYKDGTTTQLRFISTSQEIYLGAIGPDAIPVKIDIKPGSDQNPINLRSNGLVPVAIFSTAAFDATQINPATVELAGAKVATRGSNGKLMSCPEDVDGDGLMDLMLQVEVPSDAAGWVTGEITLTGQTLDGQAVEGSDAIVIVPPGK